MLERIENELNLAEKDVFEFSNLKDQSDLPDALTQEELLDEKKRERDKLGSVNLRADEETSKYEIEIRKMELDSARNTLLDSSKRAKIDRDIIDKSKDATTRSGYSFLLNIVCRGYKHFRKILNLDKQFGINKHLDQGD